MARRIRWQIVIAAVSALLVVVLLGELALSTTAISQPLQGGTYVEAVPGVPAQLIPLLNDPLTDPTGRDIAALVFDGLTRIGSDGLPEGALAASWEVDPSGEVYIFRLRRDVTWHDGTPFTADDVVFTITTIQDENFSGDPALANLWRNVLIDRIDDHTVRFTLDAPYAPFLTAARVHILPAHLLSGLPLNQWATAPFARQPVGTGPYQVAELTDQRAILRANSSYFLRPPFINTLELRFIASAQAALPGLADGTLQALGDSVTTAPGLAQVAVPPNARRITLRLDEYVVLTFNLREEPLGDLALRQALAQGLDKAALVEQVQNGQVIRIDNPILPGWWTYDSTIGWYPYAPETAAQALDALGFVPNADGIRVRDRQRLSLPLITDSDPGRLAAAAEIARQWEALGIAVEVTELEPDVLRQRLRDRAFVLAVHGWARLGADPDVFGLWHSSQANRGLNYAGLRDDDIDAALVAGRTEQDLAARNEAYGNFQRRWVELAPSIMLYQPTYNFVVADTVNGLGFQQASFVTGDMLIGREDRYRSIPRWFILSSREIRDRLR